MKMERSERHGTVREGYQILLRADAELLLPEDKPLMRAFYEHMGETCMTWAQAVHGEALRKEFLALENIREKSQFGTQRYHFRMRCAWEEDACAVILCESELLGQWREPQKSYHRISHVWNTEEETVLPFAQILDRFGVRISKSKLPFTPDGIYPEGEHMVFFRNVTDHTPFLEKRISRSSAKKAKSEKKAEI